MVNVWRFERGLNYGMKGRDRRWGYEDFMRYIRLDGGCWNSRGEIWSFVGFVLLLFLINILYYI